MRKNEKPGMASIIIELTNRCNLSCLHCPDERHNPEGENLKTVILEAILRDAKKIGICFVSFTGGEPTLHPEFFWILNTVYKAGYDFGFVTNGWNFTRVYGELITLRKRLKSITFSLDGANEGTHDIIRGRGAYRRLMKAFSICMIKDLPFTINTSIMSHNKGELREIAEFASALGSRALRFCHLMPTPENLEQGLTISFEEWMEIERTIGKLRQSVPIPILMAPGYYTTSLSPCSPLQLKEFNVDWKGNITFCCHLSGFGNGGMNEDCMGNLQEMSLRDAYKRVLILNRKFLRVKRERYRNGKFRVSDYFSCFYCFHYFHKLNRLKEFEKSSCSYDIRCRDAQGEVGVT